MRSGDFGFWTRMALMFLVRSGRATAALSIMVVTAVAALIFLSALSVGVTDAMLRNTVELFSGHITGRDLPDTLSPTDLKVAGVKGVLKRVYLPGILTNNRLGRPLLLCGLDPRKEARLTALHKKMVQGGYPHPARSELLISQSLAEELKVQTGSRLVFTAESPGIRREWVVSGIYRTQIDQLDRGIAFFALADEPEKISRWTAAVFLEKGVPPGEVVEKYAKKWPGSYRFESWETMMPDLGQLIDMEYISMSMVIVLVFGVVAIGIACSFVIFIIKNMREYGIMKAMGVTTGEMSILIVITIALMNAVACGTGLIMGGIVVWIVTQSGGIDITAFTSYNRYFTVSGVIFPRLTLFSLLSPPITAFLCSLAAAIWPVAMLARKKTADIIRMV